MVKTEKLQITSRGFNDCIDLTRKISDMLLKFNNGDFIAHIFTPSACGLFILPNGPEILKDLCEILEVIVPITKTFQFNQKYSNSNAHAYLRAALVKNSVAIPIMNGKMVIDGQIIMVDFDNKAQQRTLILQIAGHIEK